MIALSSVRKFIYYAFCFLKSLIICFCALLKESRLRTGQNPRVMRCWWEKHHQRNGSLLDPSCGDGGNIAVLKVMGFYFLMAWLGSAYSLLHPRWQNISKFGNPHSRVGRTLPKSACKWEGGGDLALSCGPCVDVCVHFQVVFKLLWGRWVDGGAWLICIL